MRRVADRTLWACLLLLSWAASAHAEPEAKLAAAARASAARVFTLSEREALGAGNMVTRPLRFDDAGGHYVGGVSYQVVDARPELVLAALADVNNWPEALPRTKSARLVGTTNGLSRVELVQGSALVDARYTVVLERADGETIRFWMDPSLSHDIRDVWGFFRVRALPGGRSLITVGAALDLGDGLTRMLFEDRIARMLLRAPQQIRAFVEPRALALSSAPAP
ncbi:MAG TPA: SRPBCC family protein [Polyangiaceae bacterium]|nr:SRPBCC family protein [Polyangiaceae bacterium]